MAFLTALLAQQGGAADQKVQNYKDAVASAARLQDLNAQQKQWDKQNADSDRDFAATQATTARTQQAQDLLDGKGVPPPPPGYLPANHGKALTSQQKRDNALAMAAYYRSHGAYNKADEYEGAATDIERITSDTDKNALSQQKEAALEQYRNAALTERTNEFSSKEQLDYTKFTQQMRMKVSQYESSYRQRGEIADLNANTREWIAKYAGAVRVKVATDDEAMRAAFEKYRTLATIYNSQSRSLNPAISGAAQMPTYVAPTPTAGTTINNYLTPPPPTNVSTVPGANGAPPIPANPGASPAANPATANAGPRPPGNNAARAADPKVDGAVDAVRTAAQQNVAPAVILRRLVQKVGLTPEQAQAAMIRAGVPLPLPPGGMRATGTNGSAGGAAPGAPFPPIQ